MAVIPVFANATSARRMCQAWVTTNTVPMPSRRSSSALKAAFSQVSREAGSIQRAGTPKSTARLRAISTATGSVSGLTTPPVTRIGRWVARPSAAPARSRSSVSGPGSAARTRSVLAAMGATSSTSPPRMTIAPGGGAPGGSAPDGSAPDGSTPGGSPVSRLASSVPDTAGSASSSSSASAAIASQRRRSSTATNARNARLTGGTSRTLAAD